MSARPVPFDDVPLCVDLDGTLIRSNLFLESVALVLRARPLLVLFLPFWVLVALFSAKARLAAKAYVARAAIERLEPRHLPYTQDLVEFLTAERARGRRIYLCTGSHQILAESISRHLGLFDGVMGSDDTRNLVSALKAATLVHAFGERGFDYMGNSIDDLAVWERCRDVLFVNVPAGVSRRWKSLGGIDPVRSFGSAKTRLVDVCREMRPHQWIKNILIFVPWIAANEPTPAGGLWLSMLAFTSFSLCASAVYLVNDLLDLVADRQHPQKQLRPLASGAMSLNFGVALAAVLLAISLSLAAAVGQQFVQAVLVYSLATAAYSVKLKQVMVVDVITLAVLYTLRIVAGAVALNVAISFWLLLFSVFLFLSLALVKRYAELEHARRSSTADVSGRGYLEEDLPILRSLGTGSGLVAVLVLGLYINAPEIRTLYARPLFIWLLCPLVLFWITHVWLLTHRGLMKMDPVIFALRDNVSRAVALLCVASILLAL